MTTAKIYDLAIIGGGINGCGIARDAAGRGLSVFLCEQGDLAQATSSASTKLIHGGLRYLEYYEFRLVREALIEREVLLQGGAAHHPADDASCCRIIRRTAAGLDDPAFGDCCVYDHLGGRERLPAARAPSTSGATRRAKRSKDRLSPRRSEYSDCWVQDARLVVLQRPAMPPPAVRGDPGANPLCRCVSAEQDGRSVAGHPRAILSRRRIGLSGPGARALINAAGPWVEEVIRKQLRANSSDKVRMVRGSHIVVKRHFAHKCAYIFQNSDKRICFAIPYEEDFTLIGTTDQDHQGDPGKAICTEEEIEYLCQAVSEYFKEPVRRGAVVWTYSGVRPLYDDGADKAQSATRDYVLKLEDREGAAPLLNVFGGKITTYRKLAEAALVKLAPFYPEMSGDWTAGPSLPGGDFEPTATRGLTQQLNQDHPYLGEKTARRLIRSYGKDAWAMLGEAESLAALGRHFGADLYEAEVKFLMAEEWAHEAVDVLWRRSKLGLKITAEQVSALNDWMRQHRSVQVAA